MNDPENSKGKNFLDRLVDKLLDSPPPTEGTRLEMNPQSSFTVPLVALT